MARSQPFDEADFYPTPTPCPAERIALQITLDDSREYTPPYYQCVKGHVEPAIGLQLKYGTGPDAAIENYCLRCFVAGLARTKKIS